MSIQNIIAQATQHGQLHMNSLDKIAKNVANYRTMGYKAERFDLVLQAGDKLEGVTRRDTTPGIATMTQNEFDVAIEPAGMYFMVTTPTGQTAYTRDGQFKRNQEGYLITNNGDLVAPGIKIPPNFGRVLIYPNGEVKIQPKKEGPKERVGQLAIVGFNNPEQLEPIGGNNLVPTADSGDPFKVASTEVRLAQGKVESSNVDLFEQIDNVMKMNAGVLSNFRVIKFSDDIFRQAVNLRQ